MTDKGFFGGVASAVAHADIMVYVMVPDFIFIRVYHVPVSEYQRTKVVAVTSEGP